MCSWGVRAVADELRGRRGTPVLEGNQVELIEDGPTLLRAYEDLQKNSRREVRVLDRPPYVTALAIPMPALLANGEKPALRRPIGTFCCCSRAARPTT